MTPPPTFRSSRRRIRRRGLCLACDGGADAPDLSGLTPRSVDSAGAALAGSLLLAAGEGQPATDVWATGVWAGGNGIDVVDGLDSKLAVAATFGARRFFVPQAQLAVARERAGRVGVGELKVGELTQGRSKLRDSLGHYVAALFARPGPGDSFEVRKNYHRWQSSRDRNLARAFYLEMLLPEIVADCRARLAQRGWTRSPGLMVTIVSHQWELVVQGALVFRPPRCLVLSTQDMEAEKDKALAELRGRLPSCEPVDRRFTEGKVMAGRVQDLLEECCGSMAAGELLFDLTPGNKEMSLDLATAVAQPGNWLTHARHKMDAGYVIPGSQRY